MDVPSRPRLARVQRIAWIATSVLFGILCIFPAITIRFDRSMGFQGIEMQGSDAESHYAARVEEIRDGFWTTGNVFYPDAKDQPYLLQPLPEWIISHIGGLFGLDAARSLILCQFLFGAGAFAVLVGCFARLTRRFWWSLMGVAVTLCAGFIFSPPSYVFDVLRGATRSVDFLAFARPVNPPWSAMLFFGALWATAIWIESRSKKMLVVMGVLMAMAFYSHIYTWTLLGCLYAVIGIYYLVRRDWARVFELACLAGVLVVAAIPYALNVFAASQSPYYHETSMRAGLILRRMPSIGLYLVLMLGLSCIARKKWPSGALTIGAFAVAALVALNQQIATGMVVQPGHYHWYFIKPAGTILLVILVGSLMYDRWNGLIRRFVPPMVSLCVGLVLCFGLGLLFQWRSYQFDRPFWKEAQVQAPVLRYIREHLHPGDTVYAEGPIRDLVPVYTSADVYTAVNAFAYLSSDVRAREAYFFDLWLHGVSADEAAQTFMTTRRAELSSHIHALYASEAFGSSEAISDQEVQMHIDAYRAFLAKSDEERLTDYPLNYVIVAANDPRTPALEAVRALSQPVYQDSAFELRKLALTSVR